MHRTHWGIATVLLIYTLLAVSYSLTTPPFEAPDEIHHYAFIRDLVRDRGLPIQHEGDPPSQKHQPPLYYVIGAWATYWLDEADGSPYSLARSNPYWGYAYGEVGRDNKNLYLHGRWDSFPYQGTALGIHLVRLLSVLMGACSVYVTYRIGLELFPKQPDLALGGVVLLAFNPMFLFISGAVNNDNLLVLIVALISWLLIRTVKAGIDIGRSLWIGLLCGLALLSKLTGLYILPVVAVVYLAVAWHRRQWRALAYGGALMAWLTLVLAGWWFARNLALYGELTSIRLTLRTWHARPEGLDWSTALFELPNAETSFWGRFGYGNVPIPNVWYHFFGFVARLGAVGCVAMACRQALSLRGRLPASWRQSHQHLAAWTKAIWTLAALAWAGVVYSVVTITALDGTRRYIAMGLLALVALSLALREWLTGRQKQADHSGFPSRQPWAEGWPPLSALGTLTLIAAAYFAAMFSYMLMSTTAANGRYMFPGLPAISILVFSGLAYMVGAPWRKWLAVLWLAMAASIAGLVLALYLRPAYAPPPTLPPEAAETVPHKLEIDYGHRIRLLGAEIAPERARPGEAIQVTLYWQGTEALDMDYAVTVQVFGRQGQRIGQRDSFTGLGNYPTTEWSPGTIVVDSYRVPLDPAAEAPVEAVVEAGLYDPATLERLSAFDARGKPVGRTLVGSFKLAPRKKPHYAWQHQADYRFGDQIALRGFDLPTEGIRPGDTLPLTLYWQALRATDDDYTVFIHLIDEGGAVRAQQDAPPLGGSYRTRLWEKDEVVQDRHELTLPADMPAGHYRLAVGLYSLATMQRLPATEAQGARLPDDRAVLWEGTIGGP